MSAGICARLPKVFYSPGTESSTRDTIFLVPTEAPSTYMCEFMTGQHSDTNSLPLDHEVSPDPLCHWSTQVALVQTYADRFEKSAYAT